MEEKISKPHDRFFRQIWSDRSVALDFLENYLPENVLSIVDLNTLEIQKNSFVEKRLRDYFSDILYRVELAGEPGFIYILFEHKSHPYYWIHLQILRYMLEIWQLLLEQDKTARRIPVVVPIVIYHGPEKWTSRRRFKTVFANPADKLAEYTPDFEYILFDLGRYSDEEIRGEVLLRAVLTLMKHIFDPDIHQKLPAIFKLFKDLSDTQSGLRSLEILFPESGRNDGRRNFQREKGGIHDRCGTTAKRRVRERRRDRRGKRNSQRVSGEHRTRPDNPFWSGGVEIHAENKENSKNRAFCGRFRPRFIRLGTSRSFTGPSKARP